jgi:RNA polymerase sigma-70 factor (ECF subfamily)
MPTEVKLIAPPGAGDTDAFQRLIEPYRGELHAHCYRMLGSPHDADDALQDALVRAWRGMDGVRERAAMRAWLYRIATNSCIDAIKRRPARTLPIESGAPLGPQDDPGAPLAETTWVEPYPDELGGLQDGRAAPEARYEQREAVELAFVAALQHLSPIQRAVLILREVLGFSAKEVSESLSTTVASVNSALQRARATIDARLPSRSQQQLVRELGDERVHRLVTGFMDAWQRADVETITALLAEDATFSMPPFASWWRGRDEIAALVAHSRRHCPPARSVPVGANGQPALGCYLWDEARAEHVPSTIVIFDLDMAGARIKHMTSFALPALFPAFGLAERPPA